MGWLEGVLTGYAKRHYDIADQKRREAELAADREGRVFETLLNSKYKDIKEYAAAGILDLSNPRRRKGGVAGWMGDIETTPYLDMIRRTQERYNEDPDFAEANLVKSHYPWLGGESPSTSSSMFPEKAPEQGGQPPATPSVPTPGGQVAPAPPGAPPAALPSTSPVTHPGSVTPATPAPPPPAPPSSLNFSDYLGKPATPPPVPPGGAQAAQAAAPAQPAAAPAGAPAGPAGAPPVPPGAAAAVAAPLPPAGPPIPIPQAPPPPPNLAGAGQPGGVVNAVGQGTPIRTPRTSLPGIFPSQADIQQDQARATVSGKIEGYAEMYRAQGIPEPEAYAKAAKLFEQDLLSGAGGIGQTYAEGDVTADPTSPTGFSRYMYLKSDPTKQLKYPAPAPAGRNSLIGSYQRQWNAIQAPVRAMEINLRTMKNSYDEYMAGNTTAWESLRTAFVHVAEPNSVVMPSEFARAAGVLSLKEMIWGMYGKALQGGAPMEPKLVAEMMRTALAIWDGTKTYGAQQRSAIEAAIDQPDLQIPHAAVFGTEGRYDPVFEPAVDPTVLAPGKTPAPGTTPAPAAGSSNFVFENGKWVLK